MVALDGLHQQVAAFAVVKLVGKESRSVIAVVSEAEAIAAPSEQSEEEDCPDEVVASESAVVHSRNDGRVDTSLLEQWGDCGHYVLTAVANYKCFTL